MSIYHCSIKIISRAGGRSAVASAAYRAGEKLHNDETGLTHDFTNKGGVIMNEIMLPDNAPERFRDRETLWNEVQKVEKRSDAQFAREVEVALPKELSREEQIACVRAYVMENFVGKGMIADWALHDKGDGNPHAHILLTLRGVDENEKWQAKQKTVFANARDEIGRPIFDPKLPTYDPKNKEATAQYRIPALDNDGNQKTRTREGRGTELLWEKINIPANNWNDHSQAEIWRASWAKHCNRYLAEENRIDHRSFERQGSDLMPTIHEGVIARQMEAEGKMADRCQINREIKEHNSLVQKIKELGNTIKNLMSEKVREVGERFRNLKSRRAAFDDGADAGRNRGTSNAELRRTRDDLEALLGELNSKERVAEEKPEDSGASEGRTSIADKLAAAKEMQRATEGADESPTKSRRQRRGR